MKKIKFFLLFAVFSMIIAGTVYAKSPVAVYYEEDDKIEVTGELDGNLSTDTVNIFVLKNSANYISFSEDDILYMDSAKVNPDNSYSFKFSMDYDYTDCRIYVKAANKYIPVNAFKATADENAKDFTRLLVEAEKNIVASGTEITLCAKAFSGEEQIEYDDLEFFADNSDVLRVDGNVLRGIKKGTANVYAKALVGDKAIYSKPEKIEVRDDKSYPSVIGVTFKKGEEILNVSGDISDADNLIFSFDAPVENISGVKCTDINNSSEKVLVGEYNKENMSYLISLNKKLGFGKFRFDVISEDMLGLSSVIEGTDVSFGVSDRVVAGDEYLLDFKSFNYRGYDIPVTNIKFSGNGISGNTFMPEEEGEYTITAEFYSNGVKKSIKKNVKAVGVEAIIPQIDNLKMEIATEQKLNVKIIGTDGSVLELTPEFSSSSTAKLTVNSKGVLYARARGTVSVTAECGGKSAKINVFIGVDGNTDAHVGTWIDGADAIECGEKSKLKLKKYLLSGKTEEIIGVTFSSDNEDIISIDENGVIIGNKIGEATLTADYEGKIYKKIISVVKRRMVSARIEIDSKTIPEGSYDTVKVLINSNEYLSPYEYTLYSENDEVIEIEDNYIHAVGEGIAEIYAVININGEKVKTENTILSVFKPLGGYFIDECDTTENLFYVDARLAVNNGRIRTNGSGDRNAEMIYKLNGDINDFMIYDYICNPKYAFEDIHVYVSQDNNVYNEVTDITRIKGTQTNGWGTDILKAKNIAPGMRYLKIVLDNKESSTQATQIDRVEIGYSTNPEVLDVQILDDCRDDEIYKNIFGRKAIITFNQPINLDSLKNITVGNSKISGAEYFQDLLRCKFVIDDKSEEDLKIAVSGVKEYTGKENIPFEAVAEKVGGDYGVSGRVLYELSENLNSERLLLKNDTLYPKEYAVIDCKYDESGKLLSVQTKDSGRMDAVSEKYVYLERKTSDGFKTFLWESFDTIKPLEK